MANDLASACKQLETAQLVASLDEMMETVYKAPNIDDYSAFQERAGDSSTETEEPDSPVAQRYVSY